MNFPQIGAFILLLVVGLGLAFSQTLAHLLTESWWFDAVGFTDVFWTRIGWQIAIGLGTFVLYGGFLWLNYGLAMTFTRDRRFRLSQDGSVLVYTGQISHWIAGLVIGVIAGIAALAAVPSWEVFLGFLNASDFGVADPLYQQDIGFYFFKLPFYEGIRGWLGSLLGWSVGVTALVYGLKGELTWGLGRNQGPRQVVKVHLGLLLAAIALVVATSFWLARFNLLYSSEGVMFGAGYTDAHARLQGYWLLSLATVALAGVFLFSLWRRGFQLPLYGIGIYVVLFVVLSNLYPVLQQQLLVAPNELEKEKPYIAHNIQSTRQAYQLEQVEQESYPGSDPLNPQILAANQPTIENIRLWDYRPLLDTYRQLQEIRLYYHFRSVDIDRYTLDGDYRQVMLAGRELSYDQVPQKAKTWVNQRLKYTHGYGLVMSPVNVITDAGLPELFIKDIPPVSAIPLEVERPGIYYGEATDTYIFTGTTTDEFDYPQGGQNAFTRYDGQGGVAIDSLWRRLVYAYNLGSFKLLISNYFTDATRIHYHRLIQERVRQIAPFLRFDTDPYLTVVNGRLQWIIDAYTTSDRYPYSEPVASTDNVTINLGRDDVWSILGPKTNYLRNSVKVVVDAYDGTLQFFVVDETDPVLATYRKIFPQLFTPKEQTPPELKSHFRYPLDLFKVQAQIYLSYHMGNPEVFYNREDLWRFPIEFYEDSEGSMEPYYVIMRLPGQEREEFMLILPFTPVNKDNMIAWMAARSDGEDYGKALLYQFPKQQLVYGPRQIEARIDQNPEISQQLTLWSQEGSRVIRGDLLVIPIGGSLLYVEPVYLRAEQGQLPELKRVIVAYDNQTVMATTLDGALASIFRQQPEAESSPPTTAATPAEFSTNFSDLVQAALETYQQGQEAVRQGNWGDYGQHQQQLGELLQQLNQTDLGN